MDGLSLVTVHTPPDGLTNDYTDAAVTKRLVVSFTVPGEPMSKARARVTSRGTFTPKGTVAAEARVLAAWTDLRHEPVTSWCELDIQFFNYTHTRRDVDNMAKLVQDSLNTHAYTDDWLIVDLHATKQFVTKQFARTEVRLYVLEVAA